jgi:hypothetical protein
VPGAWLQICKSRSSSFPNPSLLTFSRLQPLAPAGARNGNHAENGPARCVNTEPALTTTEEGTFDHGYKQSTAIQAYH